MGTKERETLFFRKETVASYGNAFLRKKSIIKPGDAGKKTAIRSGGDSRRKGHTRKRCKEHKEILLE